MGDADLVKIGQLASSPRARRVWISGGDEVRPAPIRDTWRVSLLSDLAVDDSDKSFVVPADTEYQILWIYVELITTADAGDRQMEVQVQNSGADVISIWARAGIIQIASLTREYLFAPAVADLTAFRDTDYLTTPITVGSFLQAGDILRIFDNNAIQAAADDMVVHIKIASRII